MFGNGGRTDDGACLPYTLTIKGNEMESNKVQPKKYLIHPTIWTHWL